MPSPIQGHLYPAVGMLIRQVRRVACSASTRTSANTSESAGCRSTGTIQGRLDPVLSASQRYRGSTVRFVRTAQSDPLVHRAVRLELLRIARPRHDLLRTQVVRGAIRNSHRPSHLQNDSHRVLDQIEGGRTRASF